MFSKTKKYKFLNEHRKEHVPCAYCGEPLSYELVGKFNDLRKSKNSVIPCCGGRNCMLLAVYNKTKRADGFIVPKATRSEPRPKKEWFPRKQEQPVVPEEDAE